MFEVFAEYNRLVEAHGYRYDWDDLALSARSHLEQDKTPRRYRHIVVDEGQDFSPEMLRSLALAITADGSTTVFVDVAQQIYGRLVSWRDAGLKVRKPWEFRKNYRNSPQIAELALAIAEMPYYADEPDIVRPDEYAAEGPLPVVVAFEDASAEVKRFLAQKRTERGTP